MVFFLSLSFSSPIIILQSTSNWYFFSVLLLLLLLDEHWTLFWIAFFTIHFLVIRKAFILSSIRFNSIQFFLMIKYYDGHHHWAQRNMRVFYRRKIICMAYFHINHFGVFFLNFSFFVRLLWLLLFALWILL